MRVEEDHDLLDLLLLFPGCDDLTCPILPNTGDFFQSMRLVLDDLKCRFPKAFHDTLRQLGTNPLHHA